MIDKDDFELWREHPITRAVFDRLKTLAAEREEQKKELLFRAAGRLGPQEWAVLQPDAAFAQGQNDMADYVVNMELADLQDEEPSNE